MKLETYWKKRDEERTNEPFGEEPAAGDGATWGGSFVVHLHDATRKHYDLRVERGGVLLSFAVPHGPSLDPARKHLAIQTEGSEVTTVEGLATGEELSALQAAFLEHGGVQCGFCTPGMLISATHLLAANPSPNADEVRIALSGNLCRCTGYDGIVKAVLAVADAG